MNTVTAGLPVENEERKPRENVRKLIRQTPAMSSDRVLYTINSLEKQQSRVQSGTYK